LNTKRFAYFGLLLLFVITMVAPVSAYVEPVHKTMTKHAFDRLVVDFQARLGIGRDAAIGNSTPRGLMMDGSVDEDAGTRALHHFYDPVHTKPITIGKYPVCVPQGSQAVDWALDPGTLNAFTLSDARRHYYEAVTGPNPGTRTSHLKELFITLGHVVHLVQDMAQPEHTRNDIHLILSGPLEFLNDWVAFFAGRMPSLYEAWALRNVTATAPAAYFDSYATVKMLDDRSYFHTSDGRGMADYSSRNFLTQDTNYGDYAEIFEQPCFKYPSPLLSSASVRIRTVAYRVQASDGSCCETRTVEEGVYTSVATDSITRRAEEDPFHTYLSSLDLETEKYDRNAMFYSLSDDSYERRAQLLIPRAVGYSAGLIEHFFASGLEAYFEKDAAGTYTLRIVNRSSKTIGADARLSALYRAAPSYFDRGNSDDTGWIVNYQELRDLVPGFTGIPPGYGVTIRNLRPYGLRATDSLLDFEQRVVIVGAIDGDADAVMTAIKGPRPRNSLRITVPFYSTNSGVSWGVSDSTGASATYPGTWNQLSGSSFTTSGLTTSFIQSPLTFPLGYLVRTANTGSPTRFEMDGNLIAEIISIPGSYQMMRLDCPTATSCRVRQCNPYTGICPP
jgi:hypothetical protein